VERLDGIGSRREGFAIRAHAVRRLVRARAFHILNQDWRFSAERGGFRAYFSPSPLSRERPVESSRLPFLVRHEFIIRRLHSLSGLIPVGAYMVVHLLVNASVLNSPSSFQTQVYGIHSFGSALPFIEWTFIFIPILFHAIVGVAIVAGGHPNTNNYPYEANYRYTLQRATGIIAFLFIGVHVFHMHGWFHADVWLKNVVEPFHGGKFRPFNATSTAGEALQGWAVVIFYLIGLLSCVFHLANGIWTMGITWGAWTSERAQRRALYVCGVFGVLLAVVGVGALFGMRASVDTPSKLNAVIAEEDAIYKHKIETGETQPNDHKRRGESRSHDAAAEAAIEAK
jgi:succinate dehydrogenase / fumarate reductase cytochrome b subunit